MKIVIPPRRRFWAIILNSAVFLIALVLLVSDSDREWRGVLIAFMVLDVLAVTSVLFGRRWSR